MKRFLYGLAIVAALALVILAGYWFRYRGEEEVPGPGTASSAPPFSFPVPGTGSGAPATSTPLAPVPQLPPEEPFGMVVPYPVYDYFVNPSGTVTVIQPDGQVIKVEEGRPSVLSSSPIAQLFASSFSFDGSRILASFGTADNPQVSVFDASRKSWRALPAELRGAAWSPNSLTAVYVTARGARTVVQTLDLQNEKAAPRELLSLSAHDLALDWAIPGVIFISGKPSAFASASLLRFDIKTRLLSFLARNRLGLAALWSANGSRGLIFEGSANQRGGLLSLVDGTGRTVRQASLVTLPSKCAFGAAATSSPPSAAPEFLYCAVPRDSRGFAKLPLPDAYQKREVFTADDIHAVTLESGAREILWNDPGALIDASRLKIFGSRLYFINRADQKLYSVLLSGTAR